MEVTTKKWNSIFHNWKEPWNCNDRKRPLGCDICQSIDSTGVDPKGNSFTLSVIGDLHANVSGLLEHSKSGLHTILGVGDLCIYTTQEEAEKDKKSYNHSKAHIDKVLTDIQNKQISPFNVPVLSILGNHDNFINLHNETYDAMNLFYLENGTVLKIGNMVIATLGGIYSPKRFEYSSSALHEYNKRFFLLEDIEKLKNSVQNTPVDLLITHQAPAGVLPSMPSRADEGNKYLTELLDALKPKYLIHGHHHTEYTTQYGNTTVIGLGNFKLNTKTFVNFNILTGEVIKPL